MGPPKIGPLQLPRQIQILLVIVTLANVLITAADGMRFGFTHDDLMNGHMAMVHSYPLLLLYVASIWRVSPVYRPASLLLLKCMYSVFGLDLHAWRVIYSALLIIMVLVTFEIVRAFSASFFAGIVAALLIGFHPGLRTLYFSIGLIFDLLSYILTCACLLAYLRARTSSGRTGLLYSGTSIILFWLALFAKESAVAGVVLIMTYELLDEPPELTQPIEWIKKRPLLWILVLISAVFSLAQLLAPGSLTNMEAYRPTFSFSVYLSHLQVWAHVIAESPVPWFASLTALLGGILALTRWWRLSLWCVICAFLGVLPVAFISQRDVTAIMLSLLAGLLFIGVSIEALCSGIAAALSNRSIVSTRTAHRIAIGLSLTACVLIFLWQGTSERRLRHWGMSDVDVAIMPALAALKSLPPPQPGERFVIEADPFGTMEWSDLYLFRLYYHAPELVAKRPDQITAQELSAGHWRHLTWGDNRWKEIAATS